MEKVTELKYCRKIDRKNLAEVLDVEIKDRDKIVTIIEKIEKSERYGKDLALTQMGYIVKDREAQALRGKGKEREENEKEKQREKWER